MRVIPQSIPRLVGDIVAKTSISLQSDVFYDYGHYQEVVKNLDEKDKSVTNKAKYPLVWLVMDFKQSMNSEPGIYASASLQLIIATDTKAEYTMQERDAKSFDTVLYPLYAELMYQLSLSKNLSIERRVKHDLWQRPYWGIQSGLGNGTANLFNDYIDALQIINLVINVKEKVC